MAHPPDVEGELAHIAQEARRYLREAGLDTPKEDRPEMMSEGNFIIKARTVVWTNFYHEDDPYYVRRISVIPFDDVYVVWFTKTLQNWKALVSTNAKDDMYYEVTHNGDKSETYIDQYHKVKNVVVLDYALGS